MYIVAIAWIYVVLMMSLTERSVIAGLMTFLLYGVLPLSIILYLMDAPRRKRRRAQAEKLVQASPSRTGNDTNHEGDIQASDIKD